MINIRRLLLCSSICSKWAILLKKVTNWGIGEAVEKQGKKFCFASLESNEFSFSFFYLLEILCSNYAQVSFHFFVWRQQKGSSSDSHAPWSQKFIFFATTLNFVLKIRTWEFLRSLKWSFETNWFLELKDEYLPQCVIMANIEICFAWIKGTKNGFWHSTLGNELEIAETSSSSS